MASPSPSPSPADAARALDELRLRRTQAVLAAQLRPDPRWVAIGSAALSVAGVAARQVDPEWPHRRRLRIAIGVASAVTGLPWRGSARAELWFGGPETFTDEAQWKSAENAPVRQLTRSSCGAVSATLALVVAGRIAVIRLRARGVRRLWIAELALLALARVAAESTRLRGQTTMARTASEVEAAAIDGVETPALAPQLADPTAFSIAALLLPARAAREDLLAEALPLDRVVLADRLAALARAGLIERQQRGRLRRNTWWSLTDRGRELATAHAAALHRLAR
jgi:hypothetical protein